MLDGKDQGHSDKLKPEKLELQGVMEDSKVPRRMSELYYTTSIPIVIILLWCHYRKSVAR